MADKAITGNAGAEWRASWKVVVAAVIGMMIGSIHAYSTGVMVGPLEQEFGWSRARITSGMMICSVLSVILSPFFGMLIDRYGPRRIGLFGIAFYCLALAGLSLAGQSIWTWWLLWTVLAFALLNTKPTVWIAAVSGLFSRSRGLALALVLCATGLSQALTPRIAYELVGRFGWRQAYIWMGVGSAVLALPLLWFWFSSAQDRARGRSPAEQAAAPAPRGLSASEGFRSGTFVRLAVGALAMSIAGGALTVNLIPVLKTAGIAADTAVSLAGLSGLAAIAGRLGGGYLIDRINARLVGGTIVLLPIATCAILLSAPGQLPLVMLGVFLSGIASGAEMDAIAYMASRSFGMRKFGLLFGTLSGILALGVGTGPTLSNLAYDLTGSYHIALWAVIPLSALTSLMFYTVGPYPQFDAAVEAGDASAGKRAPTD